MARKHEIYRLSSPSKTCYIGQTIEGSGRRLSRHKYSATAGCSGALYNAMREHGSENFKMTLLITDIDTQEEANNMEMILIDSFDTYNHGYNMNFGGGTQSGFKHSKESIEKTARKKRGIKMVYRYEGLQADCQQGLKKIKKNSSSKYCGVHMHPQTGKWRSVILYKKNRFSLGLYFTEEEAAKAYNDAALEYYGVNARLNNIGEA